MLRRTHGQALALTLTTLAASVAVPLLSATPALALGTPSGPASVSVSLNPTDGYQGGYGLDVTWTPPGDATAADITEYHVALVDNGTRTTTTFVTPASQTSGTVNQVALQRTHTYSAEVSSYDGTGESTPVPSSNAETVPTTTPTAPQSVGASQTGRQEVTVTWQAPTDDGGAPVTGYDVSLTDGSGNGVGGSSTAGDARSVVLSNVAIGGPYTVSVVANNDNGSSPAGTSQVSVAPVAATAPQGVAANQAGAGTVDISWSAPADDGGATITGYEISLPDDGKTASVDASTLHTTVSGLANGTHHVSVQARTGAGLSPAGTTTVETGDVPSAVQDLSVTQTGTKQVTVRWSPPASSGSGPITQYGIGTGQSGNGYPPETRSQVFDNVQPGPFEVTVTAFNRFGGGTPTVKTVTVQDPYVATGCTVQPVLVLDAPAVTVNQTTFVTVSRVASDSVVELYSAVAPNTSLSYLKAARVASDATSIRLRLNEPRNTKLFARVRGCGVRTPIATLLVTPSLSMAAPAHSGYRALTFSGSSGPAKAGGLVVNVYRLVSGSPVLAGTTHASATTGAWSLRVPFSPARGYFRFYAQTVANSVNAAATTASQSGLIS